MKNKEKTASYSDSGEKLNFILYYIYDDRIVNLLH